MSRTKRGRQWIQRHLNDRFVKQANREGYRSRAAYKLIEIDDRDRLLRPGSTVLDLGAAPGGWSQVCAERVRPGGHVIAVDVLEMAPVPGVGFVQGDMLTDETLDRVLALLPGAMADLVISDMAPNLSGIRAVDAARGEALVEMAVEIAVRVLKPPGAFLVKVFHGASFDRGLKELRSLFKTVVVRKPAASRSSSSETYLLARGLLKR